MKKTLISLHSLVLLCLSTVGSGFTTKENIRHIVPAACGGELTLYVSSLTGTVARYSAQGSEIWSAQTSSRAVLFELVAADIDGDGSDELMAASGDGSVYCWDDDGELLWDFSPEHKSWFNEVAVIGSGKSCQIFAGGNDKTLYELNYQGKLISTTPIQGMVRKLESGNFVDADQESLFLMTYQHDKYRWKFLGFLDPQTKSVIRSIPFEDYKVADLNRTMMNDFSISDMDGDGRSDVLFFASGYNESASAKYAAIVFAFNGEFEEIMQFKSPASDKQRYVHTIGADLGAEKDQIIIQFGGLRYLINRKGELLGRSGELYQAHVFYDLSYDPQSKQLFVGGEVSGGNDIHCLNVQEKGWWKLQIDPSGRVAEVKANLEQLYQQVLSFEPPVYQQKQDKPWVMVSRPPSEQEIRNLDFADIKFIRQERWVEKFDRSDIINEIGEVADKRDYRVKYTRTQKDLVDRAAMFEAQGTAFIIWSGHVTDPFCVSLDTMLSILEAAPNTCHGFLYAEMAGGDDPRTGYFVKHYLEPLVEECRKNGIAKIFFRNKNLFWAANSHLHPWGDIFFSGKYRDVLIPATEDTSSRTQDLNLAGRVGMLMGGYVDDFSMRLIEDNVTSWRPVTPAGQSTDSPFLRSGVLRAAYGARYGVIGTNRFSEDSGTNLLYGLMASGVLPYGTKETLESVGSWHLIKDIDEHLLELIENHHSVDVYLPEDPDAVISLAQMHWAGASLPAYDLSKQALGVEYRWLNFLPPMPHGMVPIAPYQLSETLEEGKIPYSLSNLKMGMVDGASVPAEDFGAEISKIAKLGATWLPIVVSGVSWAAIRMDETHIRVILLDPEYLEPAVRDATLHFNGKQPTQVVDILSSETFQINDSQMTLSVPAGSMRFIDVSYPSTH